MDTVWTIHEHPRSPLENDLQMGDCSYHFAKQIERYRKSLFNMTCLVVLGKSKGLLFQLLEVPPSSTSHGKTHTSIHLLDANSSCSPMPIGSFPKHGVKELFGDSGRSVTQQPGTSRGAI